MFGKCDEDDDVTAIYCAFILIIRQYHLGEIAIGTIVPVGRSC